MKIQALSLYLGPYGEAFHLCMEVVALGVPLGRAIFFFLNSALNFVKHLDRAGGPWRQEGGKKH